MSNFHYPLLIAEPPKCKEKSWHVTDGDGKREHAGERGAEP